jgi:hypothetical protein
MRKISNKNMVNEKYFEVSLPKFLSVEQLFFEKLSMLILYKIRTNGKRTDS